MGPLKGGPSYTPLYALTKVWAHTSGKGPYQGPMELPLEFTGRGNSLAPQVGPFPGMVALGSLQSFPMQRRVPELWVGLPSADVRVQNGGLGGWDVGFIRFRFVFLGGV